MRITPATMYPPMHIARAYGVTQTASIRHTESVRTQTAQNLVAGNVSQSVNFDAAHAARSTSPSAAGVFQMYTRAADRVEAAVGVAIGRSIDVKG